jgi:hypothetical protein
MKCQSAISNLTILSQQWERLLFSTGGGINLLKSFWFLMSWTWKDSIATLTPIQTSPGDLHLTASLDPNPVQVPRIEATSTYRTLGAHISPSGTSTGATKILKEYSVEYASPVTGSHFSREDVLWSFFY